VRHHIDDVVDDVGVVMVQPDEFAVPFERRELASGDAEPRGVVPGERVLVAGKVGPDMVENPVEQNPQTTPVRLGEGG